uniref:Uncharacterized protein n=1 Tax=Myotis myotis TaxID=51298 RepID=A0A7J7XH85_MYOMY|nr:hypothetical protein mMyoMyo1_011644 [Myotis myotis]
MDRLPAYFYILILIAASYYIIEMGLYHFFKIYFIDFLQKGRERDRELETSMREKHRSPASCTSPTGDMPATQAHAPDQNRTWDPSVRRPTLYPLSQTGLGTIFNPCSMVGKVIASKFWLLRTK